MSNQMADHTNPRPLSPRDIVRSGLCIGCGSCVAQGDEPGSRMELDCYGQYKPAGSHEWLHRRSSKFARTCPFSPVARNEDDLATDLFPDSRHHHSSLGCFQTAYVGYAAENDFRERASSGGMVSWVLTELLRTGLIDGAAHVVAATDPQQEGRFFGYRVSRTVKEIRAGAKSQYYPVELSEVLRNVQAVPGRYAVVGVPCFIKAIQLLCREDRVLRERIAFTLGLFCGHMKSARLMESFAWQMGVSVDMIQRVEFRFKDSNRSANSYTAQFTLRDGRVVQKDWWNLADGDWGAGFFQNSACNFCDDVVAETADVSFGDAWVEPYSSDGRGTNVVIVRSQIVENLVANGIEAGRLKLEPVNAEFVHETQAAGLRQRREGLAYRLCWPRFGIQPGKRVAADSRKISLRRKLIYRLRSLISAWSHRVFWLARLVQRPRVYIRWASMTLSVYHGLAYSRGKVGKVIERLAQAF
ncbi:MAG TPA: Coenzyme F420 hydrogenase/dehydrogenase, beta subunit C-terminal domain [Pyrinomonadaceae bacterium]|nr:Coenzyme F420 hydrogenase/dehydrogenase, beta subunit C-terminal domain [Pyrinomonadaceae bacterium]